MKTKRPYRKRKAKQSKPKKRNIDWNDPDQVAKYYRQYAKANETHLKKYRKEYWGSDEIKARKRKKYAKLDPKKKEKLNRKKREYGSSVIGRTVRRKRYHRTKDARHAERKRSYEKVKLDVFSHYSKKISGSNVPCCAFCKETEFLFLTIDHIHGRKTAKEKRGVMKSDELYRKLRREWPNGYQVLCYNCNMIKEKSRSKEKEKVKPHTVKYRKSTKKSRYDLKLEVFSTLSNGKPKCTCCGYKKIDGLSVDHIHGRKNTKHLEGLSSDALYRYVKKEGYPSEYQVLCLNCNAAKGHHKICPHQK